MVTISNLTQRLYSIDGEDGIVNITKYGVEHFIRNPYDLLSQQPKGIKFREEAEKMYEYLKYKKLL